MRKIQCTGCGQVFWAELQFDESLISSGEWIQNECPKCGAKWAVVEPAAAVRGRRGRKPGPKRRGRLRKAVQPKAERTPAKEKEGAPGFSAAGIRRLRKKLKVSQKQFASLVGVSTGTIVGWESGKFKPRGNKVAELSNLEKWDKKDVRTRLAEEETKPAETTPKKTGIRKGTRPKARKRGKPVEEKPEAPAAEKEPEQADAPVEKGEEAKSKGNRRGRQRKGGQQSSRTKGA